MYECQYAGGTLGSAVGVKQLDAAPNITGVCGRWGGESFENAFTGVFSANLGNNLPSFNDSGYYATVGGYMDASRASQSYGRNSTTEVRPTNFSVMFFIKY